MKTDFYSLSKDALAESLAGAGFPKFRTAQVFDAVYRHKIFSPADFPAIPKNLKDWLAENFEFAAGRLVGDRSSADETKKYLFELSDGKFVECVLLEAPTDDGDIRKTLCMSTQVGCACGCKFCASGLNGFFRNLTAGEIVAELLPFVRDEIRNGKKSRVFEFENIVVMGMGEPLMNVDNLLAALGVLNSPDKFGFGARRITVSTCGIADVLERLADSDFPYRLAISLHGATNETRSRIMPINKRFPLERLIPAAEKFAAANGRMITLEYILIKNVNDSQADARALAKIAKRLHAHVNLIPYNRVEALDWERPSGQRRAAFADFLKSERVSCTLRREKGSEIDAACGQLVLKRGDSRELLGGS